MANPNHLKRLMRGPECWNQWRKANPNVRPDLSGMDITDRRLKDSLPYRLGKHMDSDQHPIPCRWTDLSAYDLSNTRLDSACLSAALLREAKLEHAFLRGAKLEHAYLYEAKLEHADLSGAKLEHAFLRGAKLEHAFLRGAKLEHAFLRGAKLEHADLSWAKLEHAYLYEAKLEHADLREAKLEHADLRWANLEHARLRRANLEHADLYEAKLEHADLSEANLEHADLYEAKLEHARLRRANLGHAVLFSANMKEADITDVQYDRWGRYRGIRLEGAYGSPAFIRHAKDQDFIEEFRGRDLLYRSSWANLLFIPTLLFSFLLYLPFCLPPYGLLKLFGRNPDFTKQYEKDFRYTVYLLWLIFADCGRSFLLWTFWSVVMALGFGFKFYWLEMDALGRAGIDLDAATTVTQQTWDACQHAFSYGLPLAKSASALLDTMLYYSVVTFTTLGFGDVTPLAPAAKHWVMAEVILGYVMLGGLISIFANKLARRAG